MSENWKIYTKTGDKGETSLLGGQRVPKWHERIEAYGTLDEFNAFLGVLLDAITQPELKDFLFHIQDRVFVIESIFAAATLDDMAGLPQISEEDVQALEKAIDKINETLPSLSSFILPGGHPQVSAAHVARTVCRRAERCMVKVTRQTPTEEISIKYINRLSDYLFVLARKLGQEAGIKENLWKPAK